MTHGSDWDEICNCMDNDETCDVCRPTPEQKKKLEEDSKANSRFYKWLKKEIPWINDFISSWGKSNLSDGLCWRVELRATYTPKVVKKKLRFKEFENLQIRFIAKKWVKPVASWSSGHWTHEVVTYDIVEDTNDGKPCECRKGRYSQKWGNELKCRECSKKIIKK